MVQRELGEEATLAGKAGGQGGLEDEGCGGGNGLLVVLLKELVATSPTVLGGVDKEGSHLGLHAVAVGGAW